MPKLCVIYVRTYSPIDQTDFACSHACLSILVSSSFLVFYMSFATSDRPNAYAFSDSSYAHTFAMRQYDSTKDEETFRQSCQFPISRYFFLSFSRSCCPPIGFRMSRTLPRFVYFLYIRRDFRSATFTLPCQAAVEVFCNPGKDVPREKIDFTPGRTFCHVLKCIQHLRGWQIVILFTPVIFSRI